MYKYTYKRVVFSAINLAGCFSYIGEDDVSASFASLACFYYYSSKPIRANRHC